MIATLALVLAFNSGARAAPSTDDSDDTALINSPAKPAGESFGARMAHARASNKAGGVKVKKARKPRAAKAPKVPRVPKAPAIGD